MTENPFSLQKKETSSALVESERAIQEVQAAMVIAKRFPRDQAAATDRILQACTRPTLAQQALYAYPRGGQMVTGPSIRLAEALAQNWGNIQFGLRELEQRDGVSTVQAFAWDIETNVRQVKEFQVKHERKARGNIAVLEDPRDIYELVANQGARRMRACILSVIPGDVTDSAQAQCEVTLQNLEGAPEEQTAALAEAFEELGVSKKQIEKRLGHKLAATIGAEVIQLRKIFRSIKDGMSATDDWFETDTAASTETAKTVMDQARNEESKKTPPAWPQEKDGQLVDSRGIPWDGRIHSSAKSCTQDGVWRQRRGVDHKTVSQIEEELTAKQKETGTPEIGSESWFNRGISNAENEDEILEYEDVLRDADLHPEIRSGIEQKIAARRKELAEK